LGRGEPIMDLLRTRYLCLIIIFILVIGGCARNTNSTSNSNITNHFAIVLVKGLKTADALKYKIEDLPLESQPILSDKDLISYRWKDHELELKQGFIFSDTIGHIPIDGLPFVLIANDKRIYVGAFWTPISSLSWNLPAITILPSNKNVIKIAAGYPGGIPDDKSDPRRNRLIYDALNSIGKIKE
jgi:hypothetical protein